MRFLALFLLASSVGCAQKRVDLKPVAASPPGTTAETQVAEIELLRAQLALSTQETQISMSPNVMKARLAVIEAAQKLKAAQEKTMKKEN